jgi:glycosyltransferase involved in cell wall biosynthesis
MIINTSVSIVSACFNEEKEIEKTVISWIKYFKKKKLFKKFEIVITDDGSTDKTIKILDKLKKKNKEIKIYKFKKNLGWKPTIDIKKGLSIEI